jgi:predicted PurR-regulated permease PerM
MTTLRTRRRRPARSRRGAVSVVAVVLVMAAAGVLEHFAGPVTAALVTCFAVGFLAGRQSGGPRPRRRRRP